MAVLTANANLEQFIDDQLQRHDVKAAVIVYRNAYVGRDPAGNVGPFILGDEFVGIAFEKADNTDGAAGVDPATSHPASLTSIGATEPSSREVRKELTRLMRSHWASKTGIRQPNFGPN